MFFFIDRRPFVTLIIFVTQQTIQFDKKFKPLTIHWKGVRAFYFDRDQYTFSMRGKHTILITEDKIPLAHPSIDRRLCTILCALSLNAFTLWTCTRFGIKPMSTMDQIVAYDMDWLVLIFMSEEPTYQMHTRAQMGPTGRLNMWSNQKFLKFSAQINWIGPGL